jgi:hypothetical protein
MLAEDSDFTRRSLKPNGHCASGINNNNNQSNKDLFQINEDDEEEHPFSPPKPEATGVPQIIILGENQNIQNT